MIAMNTKLNIAFMKKFHIIFKYFDVTLKANAAIPQGTKAAATHICNIQSIRQNGKHNNSNKPASQYMTPVKKYPR